MESISHETAAIHTWALQYYSTFSTLAGEHLVQYSIVL